MPGVSSPPGRRAQAGSGLQEADMRQPRILLAAVNAKYIHTNLAVLNLQASAGRYRSMVSRREFTINQTDDFIYGEIFREKPDVVCFSCYIWNIRTIRRLAETLALALPGLMIWLGGPEVMYDAEAELESMPFVKGILRGEGEETFQELCACWAGELPMSEVLGITYRDSRGMVVRNPDRPLIDMDRIPFCYTSLDDIETDHRILYYESSRGCPYHCTYCLSPADGPVRFRSLELVFRELDWFLEQEVPQVKFVDRTFNCSHQRALSIWRYLIGHDRGITNFHFEITGEILTEEEIALLNSMRPGLVQLEIGVQSANPATLREIRRTPDLQCLERIFTKLRAPHNIHLHLDLIAGLPGEDLFSFARSFDQVYAMGADELQLGFLKMLKGTEMTARREEYGIISRSEPAYEVISTRWMSAADLVSLKETEDALETWGNRSQFIRTLAYLMPMARSPYDFFCQLGIYCREQGYSQIRSNRLNCSRILRDFAGTAVWRSGEMAPDSAVLDEWLTFDLYLRENIKKRAEWMPDLAADKKEIRRLQGKWDIPRDMNHHVEPFSCLSKSRCFVLFDYTQRDPVTGNASYHVLEEDAEPDE